jgi:hypothetical protein
MKPLITPILQPGPNVIIFAANGQEQRQFNTGPIPENENIWPKALLDLSNLS